MVSNRLLLLCLLASIGEANPSSCVSQLDFDVHQATPASTPIVSSSLIQRARDSSIYGKAFQPDEDASDAPSSQFSPTSPLTNFVEYLGPQDSPVQQFVEKYPWWVLLIAIGSVIACFIGMLRGLTWMLDQYEAGRWSRGQIGRPWYMDDGMVMKVGGSALMIWLAVGMVLFTQLVHFRTYGGEVRHLNKIEAIYLCIQIITTVGYGDLTPSDAAGQVLVSSFILVGVVLVGVVFADMLKAFMRSGEKAVTQAICHSSAFKEQESKLGKRNAFTERGIHVTEPEDDDTIVEAEIAQDLASDDSRFRRRVLVEFLLSMGPFVASLIIGTCFFRYYPGEGKSIWEAFYMSCVTMTSVGFGAVTPTTQGGKVFASIWMLVGVGATAHMIVCFGNWFLKRHREIQVGHLQVELLAEMDLDGDHAVDKCEFLRFELIRTGMCEKEDIDLILDRFSKLDVDKSGSIDIEDLKKIRRLGTDEIRSFDSKMLPTESVTASSSVAS